MPFACSSSSIAKPRERVAASSFASAAAVVSVRAVNRASARPPTIAAALRSSIAASIALPTPDAWIGERAPSLALIRMSSRHCTCSTTTASPDSITARFAVSPDCSMRSFRCGYACTTRLRCDRNAAPTRNARTPISHSPFAPACT